MMLLSRFWYALLALVLASTVMSLYISQSMYNRAGTKVLSEGLSSDSQVVSWYLRNAARERSAQLITFALNPKIAKALADASGSEKEVPRSARDGATSEVVKIAEKIPAELGLDAVFVIDQHGRVVGQQGYEQSTADPNFELGGYPVVADALHGYIRDDTLSWDGLYLAVARPVEFSAGGEPVGAVLGIKKIDDDFAREISQRTGASVAFYSNDERIASGAPEGFDRSQLDGIVQDFEQLKSQDPDYAAKGRSSPRYLTPSFGVVYAKLPGEAWARGAGYAVGREAKIVKTPFSFFQMADDKDKASPNWLVVGLVLLLGFGLGLLFTILEHTRPLNRFMALAMDVASGKVGQMQASQLTGVYRKIASNINDGIDHAAAKGGGSTRRAADLNRVLGDAGDQPAMSAFSFPDPATSPVLPGAQQSAPSVPKAPAPRLPQAPRRGGALAQTMPEAGVSTSDPEEGQDAEWRSVFEQFVALKQQCGEPNEGLTYEKFEGTLRKNREAIVQRHNVQKVKFSVYVKEGRAALKANPIRD
ncbi:MAG: hypothetical protein RJA70_305 [Pseudomonadota bacterium]|jgi:hypothetical protein